MRNFQIACKFLRPSVEGLGLFVIVRVVFVLAGYKGRLKMRSRKIR